MDNDEVSADTAAPPSSNDADVSMQDAKETAEATGVENGDAETGDKAAQMDTDTKVGIGVSLTIC